MTALFAVYAVALLTALLFTGSLSDRIGRRSVTVASLSVEVFAMGLFASAHSAWMVAGARVLQGLGTGTVTAALGGALGDLAPAHDPRRGALVTSVGGQSGLAIGALAAGAALELVARAGRVTFLGLLILMIALIALSPTLPRAENPETFRWDFIRPSVVVPASVRDSFIALAPANAAIWALSGLYLTLGPSLISDVFGHPNHLVGATVIAVFNLAAAGAGVSTGRLSPERMIHIGVALVIAGAFTGVVAVQATSLVLLLLGALMAGCGSGPVFAGLFREVASAVSISRRAGTVAAIFVVSYASTSIPTIAAGLAVPIFGLRAVFDAYSGLAILGMATALLMFRRTGRARS